MAPLRNSRASDPDPSAGPPIKKRKYIPGGPGGGGRFIEIEMPPPAPKTPAAASATGATNPAATPTSRPRRETAAVNTPTPMTTSPSVRPRRDRTQSRSQISSATAAALALQQGDGYKPREERGWEEFHPDLDIDAKFAVFSAEEVDGTNTASSQPNGQAPNGTAATGAAGEQPATEPPQPPPKRRPGRPPRRPDAMLNALLSPQTPKIVPPPGPNPRERLTLPKPNFRYRDPFEYYETKGLNQQNYVDRTMASVGYQESDLFVRHERRPIRMSEGAIEEDLDLDPSLMDGDGNAAIGSAGVGRVEYDMDEQDEKWLEEYNAKRKEDQLEPIKPAVFEITMTKIEKEWHALEKRIPKPNPKPPQTQRPRSSSAAAVNGEPIEGAEEQDSKCAVCDDGDCENSNAIVFCDGCDLAVHQECYGVPYIPEGQWLCRKCQLIGRGSPNCIFCPNTEGAFKQTTTSKWSHLLCAIWIPEVGIGNQTLMEPVTDVEKVPKSRWKLMCYICKQRMGASIQCSNKNCFVAFHVTCARRSQLYLKMKTGPGNSTLMDSHLLKAFCHKHVPPDWRKDHGTDAAYEAAVEYYKNTMQGKQWGDSQANALSLEPSQPDVPGGVGDGYNPSASNLHLTLNAGGNKRKRTAPKTVWKLPSGAPVIPQTILNSIVASLQRFSVRQRKQFAEDACKYWTLKREARRGAALLKRLQLQLETFSSFEMTRRNFAAMGPIGPVRLQRRINFAERLKSDVDRVRHLCDLVRQRELEKLKDAEVLRDIVDTVYFPIPPLLWPIFHKVQALDSKGVFRKHLQTVRIKLEQRFYTTVSAFSADLARIFTAEIGTEPAENTAELQMQMQASGRAPELSAEQREKRKLAKRIIKAVQPALEDALRKESELCGKPYEKELQELDLIFDNGVLSRRESVQEEEAPAEADPGDETAHAETNADAAPASVEEPTTEVAMEDADVTEQVTQAVNGHADEAVEQPALETSNPPPKNQSATNHAVDRVREPENTHRKPQELVPHPAATHPTSPLVTFEDNQQGPLSQGGIQWYMQPFDPIGTTIHEERWTGRDVMRGMSEELSEIDEDELQGLVGEDVEKGLGLSDGASTPVTMSNESASEPVKIHRTRRRGFR